MTSSDSNFSKMQEDALRRVMEMQQRSRDAVSRDSPPLDTEIRTPPHAGDLLGMIGGIKIDEEKALIGLLIFILYKQGADIKLLLGLAYLLL